MREEMTFWLAVALVAVAAVGLFRVLAAGPLARIGAVRRFDELLVAPPPPAPTSTPSTSTPA